MPGNFNLGDGFDSIQQRFKKSALKLEDLTKTRLTRHKASTSYKIFENTEDLKSHIEAKTSISLAAFNVDLNFNLSASKDKTQNHQDLFHLFSYQREEAIEVLDLNQCQLHDDLSVDPRGFYQMYGDSFLKEICYGKLLMVLVHYKIETNSYDDEVNTHLDVFYKTGQLDGQLKKMLDEKKMSFEFHNLLQGMDSDLFINDLSQLPTQLSELIKQANLKSDEVPLSYNTHRYEELAASPLVRGVLEQRDLQKALLDYHQKCQGLLLGYQALVAEQKETFTGRSLGAWKIYEQGLNQLASRLSLAEYQIRAGTQSLEIAEIVLSLNQISAELNTWMEKIDSAKVKVLHQAKVFERKSHQKYRSRPFDLSLNHATEWLAVHFDASEVTVGLQFKPKRSPFRENLIKSLSPDEAITGKDLAKIIQYASKNGHFYFKVKSKQSEAFTLDPGVSMSVTAGVKVKSNDSLLAPLIWSGYDLSFSSADTAVAGLSRAASPLNFAWSQDTMQSRIIPSAPLATFDKEGSSVASQSSSDSLRAFSPSPTLSSPSLRTQRLHSPSLGTGSPYQPRHSLNTPLQPYRSATPTPIPVAPAPALATNVTPLRGSSSESSLNVVATQSSGRAEFGHSPSAVSTGVNHDFSKTARQTLEQVKDFVHQTVEEEQEQINPSEVLSSLAEEVLSLCQEIEAKLSRQTAQMSSNKVLRFSLGRTEPATSQSERIHPRLYPNLTH